MNSITHYQHRFEKLVQQLIPKNSSHPLHKAMRYSLLSGGKRLRPLLVYAGGKLVNAPIKKCDNAALAVECIHTYSLIHDDLPCMDNDDYRRGKLSAHKKFGEYLAILSGDSLQALAFEILSCNQDAQQIKLLSQSIGLNGMALGQAMDMTYLAGQKNQNKLSRKKLFHIHHLKTAELIITSLTLGALCQTDSKQSLKKNEMKKLQQFGELFGLAFQLRDDSLDNENNIHFQLCEIYFKKALNILKSIKKDLNTQLLEKLTENLLCKK